MLRDGYRALHAVGSLRSDADRSGESGIFDTSQGSGSPPPHPAMKNTSSKAASDFMVSTGPVPPTWRGIIVLQRSGDCKVCACT